MEQLGTVADMTLTCSSGLLWVSETSAPTIRHDECKIPLVYVRTEKVQVRVLFVVLEGDVGDTRPPTHQKMPVGLLHFGVACIYLGT